MTIMTQEQLINHVEEFYSKNISITKKKNSDYAGNGDPFKSFRLTAALDNTTVEEGFVVLLGTKLSRISTLIKKNNDVIDEPIDDSLRDIANYAALLSAYLLEKKNNQE